MADPPLLVGADQRIDARASPATAETFTGASGAVGCKRGVTETDPEGADNPYEFFERTRTYIKTFGVMLVNVALVIVETASGYTVHVLPPFVLYSTM